MSNNIQQLITLQYYCSLSFQATRLLMKILENHILLTTSKLHLILVVLLKENTVNKYVSFIDREVSRGDLCFSRLYLDLA